MKDQEYQTLYRVEDDHWWYIGLRDIVHKSIKEYFSEKKEIKLLDAGCGTGGLLNSMKNIDAYGFDLFDEAVKYSKERGLKNISKDSICDIPFGEDTFDIVVSMDVLCHIGAEQDMIAIREMKRVLKKGGLLILNLPAYNFLKSTHDTAVNNLTRYTAPEIEKKLLIEGMRIKKLTYRNTILFPIVFVKRLIEKILPKSHTEEKSELFLLPRPLETILSGILFFENFLLKYFNFPFGLSVFCISRKSGHE